MYPAGGLVRDASGALYGTTSAGTKSGGGGVFKVTTTGQFALLYALPDGSDSQAGLTMDSSGDFAGTTSGGSGSVFKVTPTGKGTVLYKFTGVARTAPNPTRA